MVLFFRVLGGYFWHFGSTAETVKSSSNLTIVTLSFIGNQVQAELKPRVSTVNIQSKFLNAAI